MPVDEPLCLVAVPTFRRPQFLPRILACFDRLDYTNKKMVIINDDPDTKFIYNDDPRVEIINIDKQLQLSVKRNIFNCWNYDIIFPLDDDDLFLPDRLKNHVKIYAENPTINLFRNTPCYFVYNNKLQISQSSSFTNSSYTRQGFFKAGGYTSFDKSNHDDIFLANNFRKSCNCLETADLSAIDFVYDFGGSRYRNTFNHNVMMDADLENRTIGERKIYGKVIISPDYEAYDKIMDLCRDVQTEKEIPIEFSKNSASFQRKPQESNICYVNVIGGVGNQLFQLAAGYAYAKKHNKQLIVNTHYWFAGQGNSPESYKDTIFKHFKFCRWHLPENTNRITEESVNYKELPYYPGNISLSGYFQSLKYFNDVKEEFIKLLHIPEPTSNLELDVAMHIRRGDYVKHADIHHVCKTSYFTHFFEKYCDRNITVFTDDVNYVTKEFEAYNFRLHKTTSDVEDLAYMSKCKVLIGSNSAFSWWAAIIGTCEAYFPSKWFVEKLNGIVAKDIYHDNMIIQEV